MKTFYSLTKRQFLTQTKYNHFFYGNLKERNIFRCTFSTIVFAAIILASCWFGMVFQICITFSSSEEILTYLLKPFAAICMFMTFLSALMKGSGVLYLDKGIELLFSYPIKAKTIVLAKLSFIYFWNIGISFLLLLVPILYYDSLQKTNVWFYIIDFLQIFLIPIIPTLAGILLGNALYRWLGNLFRGGSYLNSILYLVSFAAFLAFMLFSLVMLILLLYLKGLLITLISSGKRKKESFFHTTIKQLSFS